MSRRLIVYARLSNTRGDDVSVERQLAAAHQYRDKHPELAHDCASDDLVEPKGHRSGRSESARPAFREFMRRAQTEQAAVLWVYDQSRFSRGDDVVALLKSILKRGHDFIIGDKPVDLNEFQDELNVRTNGFINAIYSLTVSNRQRRRIQAEKAAGAWVGRSPQGLTTIGKGLQRKLTCRMDTYVVKGHKRIYLDTVRKFFEEYTSAKRPGLPTIAKNLNDAGYRVRGRDGTPKPVTTRGLQKIRPNLYRGLLSDALLDRVIHRQAERKNRRDNSAVVVHPVLLLRGVLFCAHCGKRYNSSWRLAGNRKSPFPIYQHYRGDCTHERGVSARKLDSQVLAILDELVTLTDDELRVAVEKAVLSERAEEHIDERANLQATLDRLEDLAIDGGIPKDKFLARRRELIDKLANLPPPQPERKPVTVEDALQHARQFADGIRMVQEPGSGIEPELANQLIRDIFVRILVLDGTVTDYELQPDFRQYFGKRLQERRS